MLKRIIHLYTLSHTNLSRDQKDLASETSSSKTEKTGCFYKSDLHAGSEAKYYARTMLYSTQTEENIFTTKNINCLAVLISHIDHLGEATNRGARFEEVRREDSGYE